MVNNYVSLSDVKAYLPNNEVTTKAPYWDLAVTEICSSVSRQIDTFTLKPFGSFSATDLVVNLYNGILPTAMAFQGCLFIDELTIQPTLIELAFDGINFSVQLQDTNYFLWPTNAINHSKPFTRIDLNPNGGAVKRWPKWQDSIRITGIFGYSQTPPSDIHQCALDMVTRLLRRSQQRFVDTGVPMDLAQLIAGSKMERDIQDTLAYYRKSGLTHV